MESVGSVLGIWAHPDDESYLAAGVMMRAVASGGRVMCVTATRGELGSTDPARWPAGPALAEVRTRESDEAMRIMGVTERHWLDYPDGACDEVDDAEAVDRILGLLDGFRPEVITTFGPAGMTGHTDHQAASRWATGVAAALGDDVELWHAVELQSMLDRHLPRLLELGIYLNGALPDSAADGDALTLELDEGELDRKWQALRAQPSQTQALIALAGEELMTQMIAQESFVTPRAGERSGAVR